MCVRVNSVDTLFTLTLLTSKQSWFTQYVYVTNLILIIVFQYCVSEYNHLHPGALLHRNFWSTSIRVIWARNNMAKSHSCVFGRHFMACRSFHYFLINIPQHPHLTSSSCFSSTSMAYHKQFQIFQLSAQGLCGELCHWMHGWMQHSSHDSDRIVLAMDRFFYHSYCHGSRIYEGT